MLDGFEAKVKLADLIARMAKSDQDALEEFYNCTSALVYGLAVRILSDPSAAEEVTFEVYLQVWTQAGRYSEVRGEPTTWLLMMVRSRAIDFKRSRRKEMLELPLGPSAQFIDTAPNPEETLAADGRQSIVRLALNSLAPADREAIELAFYSGLSHSAIAERLGQPLGTVKSRIRNGMIQLRQRLQAYGSNL